MDLEDAGGRARFLIRDRDGKFPGLFDAVLNDAGIETVLSGVQMPRMNSIMERWVQTCRHELLDRTLIWNQRHLLHSLREFEHFSTSTGPTGLSELLHRCARYPNRLPILSGSRTLMSADGTGSAVPSTSIAMRPDQHGLIIGTHNLRWTSDCSCGDHLEPGSPRPSYPMYLEYAARDDGQVRAVRPVPLDGPSP